MNYALEVENLVKHYSGFSLENVSFSLQNGTIMGFIGENGSGKTTTIKLILDLIHRDGGQIRIFGDQLKQGREMREHIGVVFDETVFPENASAADMSRILSTCYRTWQDSRYSEYLERFALPWKKRIKDYSRGMKMKLAIAAALSHDSRLLILDEPTSGLDPIVRDEILDVFLDFIQDEDHSILISSHITSDLEKICDFITFIHHGHILLNEPKDELLDRYVVVRGSEAEIVSLPEEGIVGMRKSAFGVEALAIKSMVGSRYICDPASLESIMLFHVRGMRK